MIKLLLSLFSIREVHVIDTDSQETLRKVWAKVGHVKGMDWDDLGCALDCDDDQSLYVMVDGRGFHVAPRCTSKDFDWYP